MLRYLVTEEAKWKSGAIDGSWGGNEGIGDDWKY
jgi:hypothetical protein